MDNFYGRFSFERISVPAVWDSADADYNQEINLIAGLGQQLLSTGPLDDRLTLPQFNTPASSGALTDGKYATVADYREPQWFRFTRGIERHIGFSLQKTSAVKALKIGFLKQNEVGVFVPAWVRVQASEDGLVWQELERLQGMVNNAEAAIVRGELTFKDAVRARYVKLIFPVGAHVYVDQIELIGTKNLDGAITPVHNLLEETYPNEYATPAQFKGTKDVILTYFAHRDRDPISKEKFLAHTAYLENGEIKDTLFDSYLFLPFVAFLYEGHKKRPLKKEDWQYYMDQQFIKDKNMDALDAAVGETKAALGLDSYKATVFLSILYPVVSQTEFGVVDGKMLDFSKLEDRKIAVKWLIDEQIREFEARNYQNIEIQGFYWFTEEIDYSEGELLELIRYTTDYVRELGYITSWIPYYQATGFNDWQNLGFDLACYQPNYAFSNGIPDQRLYEAAATAKLLGMCIELEIGGTRHEHIDRMKRYYMAGAQTGYMRDALHMYYLDGFSAVYESMKSSDPYVHSLYEDTYRFIKGFFPPSTSRPTVAEFTGKGIVGGTLELKPQCYLKGFLVTEQPSHGKVTVAPDGRFVYTPNDGFAGEDTFAVAANYGYAVSSSTTIKVIVE